MKIDVHNNKKAMPLEEVTYGSVVFIDDNYYLVFDNFLHDNKGMMTLINIETGRKQEFEDGRRVEVVNARMVID